MEQSSRGLITLDPRTKLLLLLVIGTACTIGHQGLILVVKPYLVAVPFILLALNGRIYEVLKIACIYLFAAYWESLLFFIPPTGFIRDIIRLIMAVIYSFMPSVVMGWYAVSTTRVSEFTAAMQSLHISQKIIIPFVVMFRFFPTIAEEYRAIQDAMRIRRISIKRGLVAMLEYRMVPLMISVVKIGDDLSAAAATRALGGTGRRTNMCRLHFHILDAVLCCGALAVLIVFIISMR